MLRLPWPISTLAPPFTSAPPSLFPPACAALSLSDSLHVSSAPSFLPFTSHLPYSPSLSHPSFSNRLSAALCSPSAAVFSTSPAEAPSESSGREAVTSPNGDCDTAGYRQWMPGGGSVHYTAMVHQSVRVERGAVVQEGASIGAGSCIGAGSMIGAGVTLGSDCTLGFNVSLQHCKVGDRCTLHNGVSVGQDGFGFFITDKGEMQKKPQTLGVHIGNDVEIGANSCIDRGSWRDTTVGDNTKLDNLVQIGHNVVIGRCCMLCGQVGVAGSATLGDYVVLAGQVGVADHVSIVSKVRVAAKSGVISNIITPGDYAGFPSVAASEWRRAVVLQRRLGRSASHSSDEPHEGA